MHTGAKISKQRPTLLFECKHSCDVKPESGIDTAVAYLSVTYVPLILIALLHVCLIMEIDRKKKCTCTM